MIALSPSGDWTYGAAILTFVFPMALVHRRGRSPCTSSTPSHIWCPVTGTTMRLGSVVGHGGTRGPGSAGPAAHSHRGRPARDHPRAATCHRRGRLASATSYRGRAARQSTPAGGGLPGRWRTALFALTKPRIVELLLVTTIPTMLLAQRGLPSVRILLVTLAGGALAAGSANTINCYIDRDIDSMMRRTSRRPLARPVPMAVVKPNEALSSASSLARRPPCCSARW